MKAVSVIETEPIFDIDGLIKKKRVCAYCRVSSKKDEQLTSFELQVSTYFKEISNNPEWVFAGIFADRGKSGTNMMNRDQFKLMIELAKMGEIDLILTKSISRFSRKTIDTLKVIQELRAINVEVFFEKENISSLDTNFDFYLTILSSVAEEESRQISTNCLWNVNKRYREGILNNVSKLYGYNSDGNGNFTINDSEAFAIRSIFEKFANKTTVPDIILWLEDNKIKSPKGLDKWNRNSVKSILRQEKYVGDLLLQKSCITEVGSKRRKINNNIKPKYYVSENHEGIVCRELYNKVKDLIENYRVLYGADEITYKITEFTKYVYSPIIHKYLKKKTNHKGKPYEEIILQDFDMKNSACKPISATSLYQTILQGISELCANFGEVLNRIEAYQLKKFIDSNIENTMNLLLNDIEELEEKIVNTNKVNVVDDVINEILGNLYNKKANIEMKYNELRYKKAINYDISRKLRLLRNTINKIELPINNISDIDYKELISKVIAVDRDDFIFCIHLTNTNIEDINLESYISSTSICNGKINFTNRRINLDINWKFVII